MVALGGDAELVRQRRDQALAWTESSIADAERIDREIGPPAEGDEEAISADGYLNDSAVRRVRRRAEEVARSAEELLRGLWLLEPAQRVVILDDVRASPALAAALLREANREGLYTAERPAEASTWADLAYRLMERLVEEGKDDEIVRGVLVEAISSKIDLTLAVGISPGELRGDIDRLGSVLPVVLKPLDDPAVALSAWKAIARWSAHADPEAALDILVGGQRIARAWSLLEQGVELEFLAGEVADLMGDSELAKRHLRQALDLAEEIGADPVPRRLIEIRLALASARAGDASTASDLLRELRSRSTIYPASSLVGREERLLCLVEAYLGRRDLEAAARELSLPNDRWGYWWATRTRVDRLARDLEAGESLTAGDQAFHLLDALPRSISEEVRDVLEAVVETPNLEQVTEAYQLISFLGESGFGEKRRSSR